MPAARRAPMAELGERLAACLEPLGLESRGSEMGTVSYSGAAGGREIEVKGALRMRRRQHAFGTSRRLHYAGIHLTLTARTRVKTRAVSLAVEGFLRALSDRILRLRGFSRVGGVREHYLDTGFWAAEPVWVRDLVNDPAVLQSFVRLGFIEGPGKRWFSLNPGKLSVSMHLALDEVSPENLEPWLESVVALTDAAEARPAPVELEPTWLERSYEENPKRTVVLIALAFVLGLPLALFLATGLVLGTAFLVGGAEGVGVTAIVFAFVFMPIAMLAAAVRLYFLYFKKPRT